MYQVLFVGNEPDILKINQEMFAGWGGYEVRFAANLADARVWTAKSEPDMIVLGMALPDGSGMDFLVELKQEKDIPVLLLSEFDRLQDRIAGLRAGADDYLSKPYDWDELLLRVKAILHRTHRISKTIRKGPLTLELLSGRLFLHGKDVGVRQKEFNVLLLLVQNENKTLSADEIYEQVWGREVLEDNRTVRTVMQGLRRDLAGSGYVVVTEYGKGYCFREEDI